MTGTCLCILDLRAMLQTRHATLSVDHKQQLYSTVIQCERNAGAASLVGLPLERFFSMIKRHLVKRAHARITMANTIMMMKKATRYRRAWPSSKKYGEMMLPTCSC